MGKPKDAHIQVYPTTNLVHTPPTAIWCACRILLQVHEQTTLFPPFLGFCRAIFAQSQMQQMCAN